VERREVVDGPIFASLSSRRRLLFFLNRSPIGASVRNFLTRTLEIPRPDTGSLGVSPEGT